MDRVEHLLEASADATPDAPAVHDPVRGTLSYADLAAEVAAVAARMRDSVAAGDRIVIVTENGVGAVAAIFAAWSCGAICVPVNARQSAREIDRIIAHADPRVVAFCADVSTDAAAHARRMGAADGAMPFFLRQTADDAAPSDVAVVLYTTGTTGDPKGVMLTHGNVRFGGQTSAALRDMTARDVIYGALPVSHVFGLCSVLVASIGQGAFIKLVPRFAAEEALHALADGITLFSAVPQMHALIMAAARRHGSRQLGSAALRYVSSGAAPLDPAWKRAAEAFYGVAVQNGYGLTESTAGVAATRNVIGTSDISVGPALPGVDIRIDSAVPGGGKGAGEVLTRGPHVMAGYYRAPDVTATVLSKDGWLRTGDLGRIDGVGNLHILGRSKELIIRGGFNVYPPEVEAVLTDHHGVVQSAVVGRAVDGDEEVVAFVQPVVGAGLTEAALRRFASERLAGYKCPGRYVLADGLPAAPTGKILKHKLLAHFADQLTD
ncbi:MAG: AMP-binding protein [Pseudomonadota bacterium]